MPESPDSAIRLRDAILAVLTSHAAADSQPVFYRRFASDQTVVARTRGRRHDVIVVEESDFRAIQEVRAGREETVGLVTVHYALHPRQPTTRHVEGQTVRAAATEGDLEEVGAPVPWSRRLRMLLWGARHGHTLATADDLRELYAHISQADSVDYPPEPGQ